MLGLVLHTVLFHSFLLARLQEPGWLTRCPEGWYIGNPRAHSPSLCFYGPNLLGYNGGDPTDTGQWDPTQWMPTKQDLCTLSHVPPSLGWIHMSPSTSHPGINRTIKLTHNSIWWPTVNRDVTEYCTSMPAQFPFSPEHNCRIIGSPSTESYNGSTHHQAWVIWASTELSSRHITHSNGKNRLGRDWIHQCLHSLRSVLNTLPTTRQIIGASSTSPLSIFAHAWGLT